MSLVKLLRRLRARGIAYGIAVVLAIYALAFLAYSVFLQLAESVEPVEAALLVSGGLLLIALLVVLITRWATRRKGKAPHAELPHPLDGVEEVLEKRADPMLRKWVRRHPEQAVGVTLVLGIVAGYSRYARRFLQDVYQEYGEAHREGRPPREPDA